MLFQWVTYCQYLRSTFTSLVRFHPHHAHSKPLSNNEFKDISSETWPACCSSTKVRIFVLPSFVTWEMAWYSSPDQLTGCELPSSTITAWLIDETTLIKYAAVFQLTRLRLRKVFYKHLNTTTMALFHCAGFQLLHCSLISLPSSAVS